MYKTASELLEIVTLYAALSPDPSSQNSAMLARTEYRGVGLPPTRYAAYMPEWDTLTTNCFPGGVENTPERWNDRSTKLQYVEHAERNTLYTAAKRGICTQGLVLFSPWVACTDCARAMIQTGINRVVTLRPVLVHDQWEESIRVAMGMLKEAGVGIIELSGPIMPPFFTLLRSGHPFRP